MKNAVSLALLCCLALACAGAHDPSRVGPLLFLPHQREIMLPLRSGDPAPLPFLTATCNQGSRGSLRCSNVSIRLDAVLAASTATADERNRLIGLLLGVSDYNCSSFIARAFGRSAQLQTANSILANITHAIDERSKKDSSVVNIINTLGRATNDVYGQPSQLGSVEMVVELAINDARKTLRSEIAKRAKEDVLTYSLLEALGDLAAYDEICSLQRGKELAVQASSKMAREEAAQVLKAYLEQTAKQAAAGAPAATTTGQ